MGIPTTTNTVEGTTGDDNTAGFAVRGTGENNLILGLNGDDFLRGEGGNDILQGGRGNDVLDGGVGGGDVADFSDVGGNGGVTVDFSNPGPNGFAAAFIDRNGDGVIDEIDRINVNTVESLLGTRGDDDIDIAGGTVFGSRGNDLITGTTGAFVVDYSHLNTDISFGTAGEVDKGRFGMDILGGFDNTGAGSLVIPATVIANAARSNTVDGTSRTGAVNAEIDLANETFTSRVVTPALGFDVGDAFTIGVVGFQNANGTINDDIIMGDTGANVIGGSLGSDELMAGDANGGAFDVLDYTGVAGLSSITINPGGAYQKFNGAGALIGTDTVGEFSDLALTDFFDLVIAPEGGDSTVNGTNIINGVPQPVNLIVNLQAGTVAAGVVGGPVAFGFEIENFVNALGTTNDDDIIGNQADNFLQGFGGNDVIAGRDGNDDIRGQGGDDRLNGQDGNDTIRGGGGNDRIFGGDGNDTIEAGSGMDVVTGQDGADTFQFNINGGTFQDQNNDGVFTRVNDFEAADFVQIFGLGTFAAQTVVDAAGGFLGGGNEVRVELNGAGNRITLFTDGADGNTTADLDEQFAVLRLEADLLTA